MMKLIWIGILGVMLAAPATHAGIIFTNLFSFDSTNGARSTAGLLMGSDGSFYGTTEKGGTNGDFGTIFRLKGDGTFVSLFSFNGTNGIAPGDLCMGSDGYLYGTTWRGGIGFDGSLFGGNGTIFRITTNGALTTLFEFKGVTGQFPDNSRWPHGKLMQEGDGNLYGTTQYGGAYGIQGYGTIFRISPDGILTNLVSFDGTNGINPQAGLLQGADGNFYGTTAGGSLDNGNGLNTGTIFRLTPDGILTLLESLDSANNFGPQASLVQDADGNLFGTTSQLTSANFGTVFKATTNGAFTTLHPFNFGGVDGYSPLAGLTVGNDGNFYGTTAQGGALSGGGTIFRITSDGFLTTLLSFDHGEQIQSELLQGCDGNFYGTTSGGGKYGYGYIFRLSVPMPPAFRTLTRTNESTHLTWNAVAGQIYQVQYSTNLSSTNWNNLGSTTTAINGIMSTWDSLESGPERFYRIVLLP